MREVPAANQNAPAVDSHAHGSRPPFTRERERESLERWGGEHRDWCRESAPAERDCEVSAKDRQVGKLVSENPALPGVSVGITSRTGLALNHVQGNLQPLLIRLIHVELVCLLVLGQEAKGYPYSQC
ncbi:hypothetical protein chiPu_0004897 [Chiloscyllium punctatum]|uniref:Uncharacterized protein n=1 Tax=Chiloscyllium punctatum TaxID=137246 RepID=A0A401S811_CHIPU|nr:hypothetical protein [Chiloscyllium punctatum]